MSADLTSLDFSISVGGSSASRRRVIPKKPGQLGKYTIAMAILEALDAAKGEGYMPVEILLMALSEAANEPSAWTNKKVALTEESKQLLAKELGNLCKALLGSISAGEEEVDNRPLSEQLMIVQKSDEEQSHEADGIVQYQSAGMNGKVLIEQWSRDSYHVRWERPGMKAVNYAGAMGSNVQHTTDLMMIAGAPEENAMVMARALHNTVASGNQINSPLDEAAQQITAHLYAMNEKGVMKQVLKETIMSGASWKAPGWEIKIGKVPAPKVADEIPF